MKKEGEESIKVRISRKVYIPIYLMIIILFFTVLYIKILGREIAPIALGAVFVFSLILIIISELNRLRFSYEINNSSIVFNRGIINKSVRSVDLFSLSDATMHQTLWQRIINIGNINAGLYSDGEDSSTMVKNINNPKKFISFLNERLNNIRKGNR